MTATPDELPPGDTLLIGLVPLNGGKRYRGSYRYAAYILAAPGPNVSGIRPLWGPYTPPETLDKDRKRIAAATYPGMVYQPKPTTGADTLPAYHFALNFSPHGWGSDQGMREFARDMTRHTKRHVSVCMMGGWSATIWHGGEEEEEI